MADNSQSFADFFAKHKVSGLTRKVYPSARFEEAGLAFTISVMSQEQMNDYRIQSTKTNRRGQQIQDPIRFNTLIVLNHVTDPDFRNVSSIKAAGCVSAQQYMEQSLLPGEIANLAAAVTELSGFGDTIVDAVDDVKN